MDIRIRQARIDDLEGMIDWAAREGWNPGIDDLAPFFAADPQGYWLAEIDVEIAACISLVHHHPDYAFLGFYIADPKFRGQGIGHRLWREVIARSSAATIGLDGVVAQQQNYLKSGFAYAHANWRYSGEFQPGALDPELSPVPEERIAGAISYDARHNPTPRPNLMTAWLADNSSRKSACLIRDGEMQGLGTIRACREGHKIGPLFAGNEAIAERLFRHLVAIAGGGLIYLDIPEPNKAARRLCEQHGMTPVFETARMYRGLVPDLPLANIFGITTFELG
jgi:GNAT superfamily N-acetyltransferase